MTGQSLTVRPIKDADRVEWERLWDLYLDFYGTGVSQDVRDTYFARLLGDDAQDFNGFLALLDGKPVGLVHYLFHRHGWKIENVCYLQDLYALPETRGTGVGRALIEAVYQAADDAGAPSVYWLTQEGNATARRLYDRIAKATDFIKYQRAL
ncbi:MAG: GNAT family N-acetyltransferase [Pseudooceanicola sp.]